MEIKDHPFYLVLEKELKELGFTLYSDSMLLFPIWFNQEKQLFIQAVALKHFASLKQTLSPTIWQDLTKEKRDKFIHFFCIWEDTWNQRSEFVKNHVHHLLHGNSSIFARDLKVGFISESLANDFLNNSHILGNSKAKFYVGIFVPQHRHFRGISSPFEYEGNPLVGVAVFGKTLVMKNEKYVGQHSTELVRFASLPGTRIVGGVTKVMRFYQKTFLVDNVMTYVDLEWNSGQGFLGIGFTLESMTNPLLFEINELNHRVLVNDWEDANACNAGNLKLRYEFK